MENHIGITSTYVENTPIQNLNFCFLRDHLHIRGEYEFHVLEGLGMLGSPPHTWRIQFKVYKTGLRHRITSTYVENTNRIGDSSCFNWDHLHIRGEYTSYFRRLRGGMGSPPHTWRIPAQRRQFNVAMRITSTYVENTRT